MSRLDGILQPEVYPDLYGNIDHVVRINYYPPRGDNKEGWDNIDIFGWLGYPMQIKVDFLCRDSILAAPIVLDLALFLDLAKRAQGGPQLHQRIRVFPFWQQSLGILVLLLVEHLLALWVIGATRGIAPDLSYWAVPLIGAAGAATVNLLFMQHFQEMARGHFVVRRLERKYGKEAVQAAYEEICGKRREL